MLRDYRLSKPLIAAVEGYAVAGGTEILQGTDIRVAGEGAIFGVWEAKRGLFPLGGSACRLPRQIPYTHAMDILLRCPPVPAPDAKEMGLIGHVVPDGQALDARVNSRRRSRQNAPLSTHGDPAGVAGDRAHGRRGSDGSTRTRSGGKCSRARTRKRARRPSPKSAHRSTKASSAVSEAAPGIPDSPVFATPERATLAAALRKLIDAAVTSEDPDAPELLAVAR